MVSHKPISTNCVRVTLGIDSTIFWLKKRRIARGVKEVDARGVVFYGEEHAARWKFVCARNILHERFLSEDTYNNQTYSDILREEGMLNLMKDTGPHWPQLVKEFICLSKEFTKPRTPMHHKVKLCGHIFKFSPTVINKHYDLKDEGSTGATLKLGDIIEELTSGALKVWPVKGQLQASSLSLRYAVLHKASIANLVPTSNNIKVVKALARMLYVMGSEHVLNIGKIIFDQVVDHAKSGTKFKPIGFLSLICSLLTTQHPDVLKKEDGIGEDVKPLTISDKLMKGKHVVDVNVSASAISEPVPEGNVTGLLLRVYEDELTLVEVEIQTKTVRASVLRTKIGALKAKVNPSINASNDTSTSHM